MSAGAAAEADPLRSAPVRVAEEPPPAVSRMSPLSPSFSVTIRVRLADRPGAFAALAQAIADTGGSLGAIDLVRVERDTKVRDVTIEAADADHLDSIVAAVRVLEGIEVEHVSDRTFLLHLGGKIEMQAKAPIRTRDDLSMAYTPGVARICQAIVAEPATVWNLTIKQNAVAVVTDGTAVLGLGDIGPEAALPVMEGKAALFKEFGGVDAWPLCLATRDVDEIVAAVTAIAPVFGGINLEDISSPRCFEVEARLRGTLDIPVFHDDQHGTAIVVLAALLNALEVVGKRLDEVKIVLTGVGAAGIAVTDILLAAGAHRIIGCDRAGAVHRGRAGLDGVKAAFAGRTNPDDEQGNPDELLAGADVFIGLSTPGAVSAAGIGGMNADAIVFAMANPTPEVAPDELRAGNVRVIATGRSDYPNQINNVLAFPGVFRGALDVRASTITEEMKVAAGRALAAVIPREELSADYVIPSVFNRDVAPAVAAAVADAAERQGVARRQRQG
jgi:malate dehydrogenase (oxaloacetate-decarboxylating)